MSRIPFVTPDLRLVIIPADLAPPAVAAFWYGSQPAYRLDPVVFAHLHHAADKALSRPGMTEGTARALMAALDRVYAALVAVCPPADVRPWSPSTPPLPVLPERWDDLAARATPACDFDRGLLSAIGRWSIRGGIHPVTGTYTTGEADQPVPAVPARKGSPRATSAAGRAAGTLW